MSDCIEGKIQRIICHKRSQYNGLMFLIARLDNGEVVKGNCDNPVVGEPYRFWGQVRDQKGNYGPQFEFIHCEPLCDGSTGGMVQYLSAHVHGLGRVKAERLVEHFGAETLTVLRTTPERATEIEGVGAAIVGAIRAHFDDASVLDPVAYSRLIEMFAQYKIGKRIVERLVRTFGSSAPDRVLANPYLLLGYPRIGWKTVDAFATTTAGYPPEGKERHRAAIAECLERIASDGHTCATQTEILNAADSLLGCHLDRAILDEMVRDGEVVETRDDYGPIYQLAEYADAEATIASKLAVLMAAGRPLPAGVITDEWIEATGLGDDQARAAKMMAKNGVCILAGPPGTGKSWLLSRFLGRLKECGIAGIRVMAPTGKASKRSGELLSQVPSCVGIPCTTIHKALAPSLDVQPDKVAAEDAKFGRGREEFRFGRDEAHPFDESVIVADETSMIDVKLMASLLRAVKPGTRLILVGDWNQLPSVGAGSVLRDIRGLVPTAELTEIRRSDGGGTVVRACHSIKDGRVPRPATNIDLPTENWIHFEINDPQAIAEKIVELHTRPTKQFDRVWDRQVISPQNSKPGIGCDVLNRLLSAALNPGPDAAQEGEGGPAFRIGDKVVRTKNGLADELAMMGPVAAIGGTDEDDFEDDGGRPDFTWQGRGYRSRETPIVNGDMGEVLDIVMEGKPSVIVRFRDPERLIRLPLNDAHLILAYAMTAHRMQGSGQKFVIIPVHKAFYEWLVTRENFYSSLSRTEILAITVGQWAAVEASIRRPSIHLRKTTLARRLDEAIAATPRPDEVAAGARLAMPPSDGRDGAEAEPDAIEDIDPADPDSVIADDFVPADDDDATLPPWDEPGDGGTADYAWGPGPVPAVRIYTPERARA